MSNRYRDAFPSFESPGGGGAGGAGGAGADGSAARAPFDTDAAGAPGWTDWRSTATAERLARLNAILEAGMHGIAFSPYIGTQRPGSELTEAQIRERLEVLRPHVDWIRTFSCREGNERTPGLAHEMGLKTMVGVELGPNRAHNEEELRNGIALAQAGEVDILAVGNEVLLREDLTPDELVDYIERARAAVRDVPVSYVDAYFLFEQHPTVTAACDVLLINCYPFWEKCPLEHSLGHMQEMVRRAFAVADGKRVIISETGWPSAGSPFGPAIPGEDEALTYFLNAVEWTRRAGIDLFYFAGFDESWKVDAEGDVGAHWGLWHNDGTLKYR